MWAEFGLFALCLAFGASLLGIYHAAISETKRACDIVSRLLSAQFLAIFLAFACLTIAFVTSDFSVQLVVKNSHSAKPLLYKIAGVWGNHEGSMLLWMLMLSLYCAAYARLNRRKDVATNIEYGVMCLISAFTLLFILAASNPFLRMDMIPSDGHGLNPLLQDPGLAIHPPILYAGYVGFAIPYAMALGTLITGQANKDWGRRALPWIITPLAFLTLGVGLGSWWAYRELGWGGFWFWDPVENASLLPWLLGAALTHMALILRRSGSLGQFTLLLAILTFSSSILGTFLVRSGVLTSVHSFAVDPKRGLLIFLFLLLVLIGGLSAYYMNRQTTSSKQFNWAMTSRPGLMTAGVAMLIAITATVLLGTLYPLAVDAFGGAALTVGAPYFNATARPLGWLLVAMMTLAPFALWTGPLALKGNMRQKLRLSLCGLAAILSLPITFSVFNASPIHAVLFAFTVLLCALIILFALKHAKWTISSSAMIMAHGGIAFATLGMTGAAFFSAETIVSVDIGDQFDAVNQTLRFDRLERDEGPNYIYDRAHVSVLDDGGNEVKKLYPERRWYPAGEMLTSEAVIDRTFISDFYVTLGDLRTPNAQEADWALRVYYRPFISWVWLGCLLTFLGTGLAAIGRFRGLRQPKIDSELPSFLKTAADKESKPDSELAQI